jgi:hypothetical protein
MTPPSVAACPESHRHPPSPSTARLGDDGGQLPLAASIAGVHRDSGNRLRALLRLAIERNGLLVLDLAAECDVDEKQLGRCLRDDGGAHPPLAFIACLLSRDRERVILHGLAGMLGYEATPKKTDLEAENRHLRASLQALRGEIDALLGGDR